MALVETVKGEPDKLWIVKDVLHDEREVWIIIAGNKIAEIIPADLARKIPDLKLVESVDGKGLVVVPALVDPHCHSRVLGEEHKEDEHTIVLAAEYGGVQTMGDMPNNKKAITTIEALEEKITRFDGCHNVDVHFWFGATPTNQQEFASLAKGYRGRVLGIKQYDGSSTGDLLVADEATQYKNCAHAAENNLIFARHAEDEMMMRQRYGRIKLEHGNIRISDHCQIRDTEVEVSAVKRALRQNKEIGGKLYLCHLSTPEAVELAYEAKQAGQQVYVEVCVHHLFFDHAHLLGNNGPFFKMNPALRTLKQVQRLRELVLTPGYVDVIATDHAPHLIGEKMSGEYDKTPSGVTGLETMFSAMWSFVHSGQMSLDRFVSLTSRRAAQIFDLSAGVVEAGAPANFLLVHPTKLVTWWNDMIHSKCAWTPFSGHDFHGDIEYTIRQGTCKRIIRNNAAED